MEKIVKRTIGIILLLNIIPGIFVVCTLTAPDPWYFYYLGGLLMEVMVGIGFGLAVLIDWLMTS